MRKIILAAILAAAAFGGNFEQATKIYLKKSDFENGARLFEKSCNDDKNAAGCYMAAFLGEQGLSHDDDGGGEKIFALYKKACDMGDEAGCSNLGFAYANGRGARQDYVKASEFYAKACDMGNGGGCYNLGNLYAQGRGVKEDANAAKNTSKKRAIWSRSWPATDIKNLSKDNFTAFARQI